MIKAKKGLLIALFAAMMVFAFGATSVFAGTTNAKAEWNSDFTSVTISGCTNDEDGQDAVYNRTYTTFTKTFNVETGQVDVVIKAPDVAGISQDFLNTQEWANASYYDLNNAAFAKLTLERYWYQRAWHYTITGYAPIYGEYVNGGYTGADGLLFGAPDYVTNKDVTTKVPQMLNADGLNAGAWQGKIVGDEDYKAETATEQNFNLSLDVTYDPAGTAVYNFVGVVPAKAVKVQARPATVDDVKFYVDEVSETGRAYNTNATINIDYDGAAHKLVSNAVEGFTVSYAAFNKKTGKFDPVGSECPAVTNVSDSTSVQATIADSYPATDTRHKADKVITFALNVNATTNASLGFDPDGNNGEYAYKVESEIYDVFDYVIAQPVTYSGHRTITDADKAAVEANQTELKAWFKEGYDIETSVPSKQYPNVLRLTITPKKDVDQAEINKKYEDLFANFNNIAVNTTRTGELTVEIPAVINDKDDDITFTYAPNATYKAKVIKKKTKSFTVVAEAKSGNVISYKLTTPNKKISIDSATGKITVKKGLKKGTYKVTVKAVTDAGNGYKACKESVKLTIKIKK